MSQPQQMNMGGMGGPVGGAPPQQAVGTPSNGSGVNTNDSAETVKRLNTYIYDYFLRNQHYDIARAMIQSNSMELLTQTKQSPNQRQNQPNGIDEMDTDRPKDLPEPGLQNTEGPFLQDWWFQFWDIYNSRRNNSNKQSTMGYVGAQRASQKQRGNLMAASGIDPGAMQNMRQVSMMSNGMMSNDLKKAAMQNAGATNMTPQQQMAQMQRIRAAQGQHQMMQGQQMERSNSQMEMNGPRSGSPVSGDAPSPKRQRMDGSVQQMGPRPGQQGQMPNTQVGLDTSSLDPAAANQTRELLTRSGIDPNAMPVEQFNLIAMQPTNHQQKSVDQYSHQMQQSAIHAMNQAKSNMNKGMPPNVPAAMGPAGAQGSPLSQAGIDPSLEFGPNGAMRPGIVPGSGAVPAGAAGGPNNGNHALQDYQMQLMLLEQQNKKRLLMARQEQDSMSSHPSMPPGANGQFAPNMSPQGSRAGGPSPGPNEMARGTPKMQPGASPNGHMQGRVSPAPGFDPSQGIPPNMRNQMVMGPNGQMMPRSHPQFAGGQNQLTQGQLEMFNRAQMMPNGTFPGGGQPMPPNMMPGGPPMQGQQQPGQGPPNMTPRQGNQAMPPPPAPQPNTTGGTQPSSPAAAPAPPTPNQSNKAKPGAKKDNKSAKAAANKKGGQTGATPASESEQPPTPTPATPITPMNPAFNNKQQIAPNGMPNGAQQQQPQHQQQQQPNQNTNGVQQPPPDMGGPFGGSGNLVGDENFGLGMDFADVNAGGGDVLDNFDFDSFLNTDDGGMGFDFPSFDGGLEAGGDVMGGQ